MKAIIITPLRAFTACLIAATAASASSPDAWETFRADVEKACLAATAGLIDDPAAWVDPFGSESFGIALVSGGADQEGEERVSFVCVYDKATGKVELSGEVAGDLALEASADGSDTR